MNMMLVQHVSNGVTSLKTKKRTKSFCGKVLRCKYSICNHFRLFVTT